MLVNIKNTTTKKKAIPGMPGVMHFFKPGETKEVELPDDLPKSRVDAWGRTGLSIWVSPLQNDAPPAKDEVSAPKVEKQPKPQAPKAAPPAAKVPDPAPTPKVGKDALKTAPQGASAGEATPAPWQRGLEVPK